MENKIDHITYTVTKKFQFKFYWNETTSIIFFLKLIRLTRINRMQMLSSYHWQQNLSNDFIIWEWYLNPCYNSESLLCTSLRFCIFFRFCLCHVWNNLFLNLLSSKNEKILSDSSFRHLWYFYILTSLLYKLNLLNRPTGYRNIPEYIILTKTVKYFNAKKRPMFYFF